MTALLFGRRCAPVVLLLALAYGLMPRAGLAQTRFDPLPTRIDAGGDPATPDFDLAALRRSRAFRLFAGSEFAVTGTRGAGDLGSVVNNVGPCDLALGGFCYAVRPARAPANWTPAVNYLQLIAGVPPSDWSRAAALVPSLRSARGGGWSVMRNDGFFTGLLEIGPADGSLGALFSGATTTTDGSCLDNTGGRNGFLGAGSMSLAASDCPPTWAGGGFAGEYRIPVESWLQLFRQQGSAFGFDRHRVPDSLRSRTRLLGDFQTYGLISDHRREILTLYGAVVPGGTDAATIFGWPLGLEYFFRVYTFQDSRIASAIIWEMYVVNRSQDVYGVRLDYDSLYLGIEHGLFSTTMGQYWDPARSTMIWHSSGVNPSTCADPTRIPSGGSGCTQPQFAGYRQGGAAIVWLKSPYGDQRNTLFTRQSSPFYDPSHPAAGDTILLNHGHMCGFSSCSNTTTRFSDKRGFGLLSSQEAVVLDGRTLGSLSNAEAWQTFRSREYATLRGSFNKWVPGGFDPNHDGVQDTLFFDTCGGRTPSDMALGCVTLDADTMPGGQINAHGNIGGISAVGPFRLAAGDTAAFTWAFVGARDSASTMGTIDAIISFYQSFYSRAEPPAVARVVSTTVGAGGQNSRISLLYSEDAENWVDDYLLRYAADIDSAPAGTELARLRALNPGLAGRFRVLAADNLEQLEIYKSCDRGVTFTADSSCRAAPLLDPYGQRIGLGWRPYAVYRRPQAEPSSVRVGLPNEFVDGAVLGGRRYLYVIVGRTRGVKLLLRDSVDTNFDGSLDGIGDRELLVATALADPLSTDPTDPNVVSVYVPASRQAGSSRASVLFTPSLPADLVPLEVELTDAPVAGAYRAVFGNRFTIVETRSAAEVESTVVTVEDAVVVDSSGVGVTRTFDAVRGTSYAPDGVLYPGQLASGPAGTTISAINGFGVVIFRASTPLLVSGPLWGSGSVLTPFTTPAAFYSRSNFPGFVIAAADTAANRFARQATLGPRGDTLPAADSMRTVGFQPSLSGRVRPFLGVPFLPGGDYHVAWVADPFSIDSLVLNALPPSDPRSTEARLRTALAARPVGSVGAVDSATAALAGFSASDLIAVKTPFAITNTTTGRPVTIAMRGRVRTRLLGVGPDTLRVAIPEDVWLPGDSLTLIESVEADSTVGPSFRARVVLNPADRDGEGNARPFRVLRPKSVFSSAVIGCLPPRTSCNPVRAGTPGATGYTPLAPGSVTGFVYYTGFSRATDLAFSVTAPVSGTAVTAVSRTQLDSIRVVPNPFVLASAYQSSPREPRVIFTHLPPRGTLRIYTVSGQFVQQITWTEADLDGAGDLHYDLRTREGRGLTSGLYLWVVTTDAGGTRAMARGKFVVIR